MLKYVSVARLVFLNLRFETMKFHWEWNSAPHANSLKQFHIANMRHLKNHSEFFNSSHTFTEEQDFLYSSAPAKDFLLYFPRKHNIKSFRQFITAHRFRKTNEKKTEESNRTKEGTRERER